MGEIQETDGRELRDQVSQGFHSEIAQVERLVLEAGAVGRATQVVEATLDDFLAHDSFLSNPR